MGVLYSNQDAGIDRAVDVHVAALRRKLGHSSSLIETVRGVGYRFRGQKHPNVMTERGLEAGRAGCKAGGGNHLNDWLDMRIPPKTRAQGPWRWIRGVVLVTLGVVSAPRASEPQDPTATKASTSVLELQDVFAGIAERVFPSVVRVTSYVREEPEDPTRAKQQSSKGKWQQASSDDPYPGFGVFRNGSGIVVGAPNQILTLRELVIQPDSTPVDLVDVGTHDGRDVLCRVVGVEPTLNLALLEFLPYSKYSLPKTVPATIGDSDSLRVGYWALALGDPMGPGKVFAAGVVSGLPDRRCYQDERSAAYLQASMVLHPESHGGPLVNARGQVVGITVPRPPQKLLAGGLEYALPMNVVLPVYEGIRANKSFRSPWLGISVLEIAALRNRYASPAEFRSVVRSSKGVYIDDVFEPSPASRAGIRVGDFMVSINGRKLFSVYRFQEALHLTGIGNTATLEILREGKTMSFETVVEERPEAATPR